MGAASALLGSLLALSISCREGSQTLGDISNPQVASPNDWQTACEARLDSVEPSTVELGRLSTARRWTLDPTPPLGRVVGLAWDAARRHVVALDNSVSQIFILDTLGHRVAILSQYGDGPGDIDLKNMAGGTNRLALLPGGDIVVSDVRHTKVFSHEGTLRSWIVVDSLSTLDRWDMQLAPIDSTRFIAVRTGKQHSIPGGRALAERTRLTLVKVDLSTQDPKLSDLGNLRNSYVMLQPNEPFPGYQAYRLAYRRSWAGSDAGVVAISWKRFGVCYFDWTGRVRAAFQVDAKRLRVDKAERERVLTEEMGTAGRVPFQTATAEELYGDRWPSEGPLYVDLVSDPHGTTWALRLTQGGGRVVDVYTQSGYRGSFVPASRRLPLVLADSMAFGFNPETGTLDADHIIDWISPH